MKGLRGALVLPEGVFPDGAVLYDDHILEVVNDANDSSSSSVLEKIDGYILPGFVDIHNHGGMNADYMDSSCGAYDTISVFLASHGVTAALATSICAPIEATVRFLDSFRSYRRSQNGAALLGIHLEGPFLAKQNKGAQPEKFLRSPEQGHGFIREYSDIVKLVTVAPELPGMPEMIRSLVNAGIVVSGGHDDSVEEDILKAIDAGMSHTTHVYCAMSALRKRNGFRFTGLCETSLIDERLTTEMIGDNQHTPPALAKLIYRCKGAGLLCLVSDCTRAGGMPADGTTYYLGLKGEAGQPVLVEDGVCMLPDRSVFAGSVTTLDVMVANMVRDCDIALQDAVTMASLTPASVIGAEKTIGSIRKGKHADFCLMDMNLNVVRTILRGQTIFSR